MNTPAFLWLIVLPLMASPLIYLCGRISKRFDHQFHVYLLGIASLVPTGVMLVIAAIDISRLGPAQFTLGAITLQFDGLSLLLAVLAIGLSTMVVLFSGPYMANERGEEKYYAMLLAMLGVIIGLGCANDLFNLWIWFEAMAVSSYLLVAFYRERPLSLEAGVKYLIQSAAGSVLVLLGIGLVFSQTGSLNFGEIQTSIQNSPSTLAAGILFVIGFGVKTALVPLHTWLPDAHSMAPSGISAMLSGIVIEAGLVAMLRSLGTLSVLTPYWGQLLMAFGALNMFAGNLMALGQRQVKRLLAYSSLVHVGYMLMGLGIAIYMGASSGAEGGLFHMVNHGLMKGLAFLAAGALLYTLHISTGEHKLLMVDDLAGAAKRYPLPALTLSLALLSLAGLPPLAGFMSKWQIFEAGIQTHNVWIAILVVFAALNSVLSLAYYAPLVNTVYRLKPSEAVLSGKRLPLVMNIPIFILALAIVAIGIWPMLMNWLTGPAGIAVLTAFSR